jgi:hypothetical protein
MLPAIVWTIAIAVMTTALTAPGQTMRVDRPRTLVVGTPSGGARTDRIDGARTGRSRTALPATGLRTQWRTPLGMVVEQAPLVDVSGTTYIVGTRGEVVALGRDGAERWRASTGAVQPGPAAILADDTLVFVDGAGEAIAVRSGLVRWRMRFGRGTALHPAPLPLDDGGVVVATTYELAALDVDGRERARIALREATVVPLVAALGKILVVTTSGAVWSWSPGASEVTRVASFGSAVDGGAALADDHTLVAVTADRTHLAAIDLWRGVLTTRAIASAGLWLGPPAMRGATAHLVLSTATSELAVAIDGAGNELGRSLLALHAPSTSPTSADGGVVPLLAGPHTPPLVDGRGDFAFATADGAIGVSGATGVEKLSNDACEPPLGGIARSIPPVVGLAPLELGAFVAVCHAGAALAITGRTPGAPGALDAPGAARLPSVSGP